MMPINDKYGFEVIKSEVPEEDWLIDLEKKNKEFIKELPIEYIDSISNNVDTIMKLLYDDEDEIIEINNMENIKDIQEQTVADVASIENMDNVTLAQAISDKLGYEFSNMILVKPLDIEKVTKTLTVPEDSGEKDEEGNAIMQMTIKQVETDSMLRKGIVIAVPVSLSAVKDTDITLKINIGDTIVYPNKRSIDFDLYKDSALISHYEVLAKVK